ncbi:MAG: Hsp20/alpha crystallin family protein [Bacteroidota bacterium]
MTVVRWNPVNEMMSLQREMNRFFNGMPSRTNRDEDYESAVWSPMTDITEDVDKYELSFDLPGMKKEQIRMNFSDNTLKISGERASTEQKKDATSHRIERVSGKFYRSFTFPTQVNAEHISATYTDGVLVVTVPKAEEVKPRQISIN